MDDANPILVTATRGNWVENRHRAAFVVADATGRVVYAAGDIARPVFPRSAIKSIQALAIFTSGAAERFGITDEELALACASHQGEPMHVSGVASFLGHEGLSAANLECGAHAPTFAPARDALRARDEQPSPLHNNCSGKHSGMLGVALALGVPTQGYIDREHAVQKQVRAAVEAVLGVTLTEDRCGIDGCSIPTWAAPLSAFAMGFARMATGAGLSPELGQGAKRIFDAATSHPELVGGTGNFDSDVMRAFSGRVMQKGGAEGVQCGAIRDLGLGYAIKVDDGHYDASRAIAAEILAALAKPDAEAKAVLDRWRRQPARNVRKRDVGALEVTEALRAALR